MSTLPSRSSKWNEQFNPSPRKEGESNIAWLNRHLGERERVAVLMFGGTSPVDFRLRVAQSQLRSDLTPSHWSHVALLGEPQKKLADTKVYEISLMPASGFAFPTPTNGLQVGKLGSYEKAVEWPNIALLYLPKTVSPSDLASALYRFQQQRVVLDGVQLLVAWLAYVWGVGRAGNPLLDGLGIPSAAMLEIVTGAVGFDLTPGLESRASCPEAIWQAARWWHEYHEQSKSGAISGVFHTSHYLMNEYEPVKL